MPYFFVYLFLWHFSRIIFIQFGWMHRSIFIRHFTKKALILIAKIFGSLLIFKFDELKIKDIYWLKYFGSWVRTFIVLTFLLSKIFIYLFCFFKHFFLYFLFLEFMIFLMKNFHVFGKIEKGSNIVRTLLSAFRSLELVRN